MKHHHRLETQQHDIAVRLMSKEAEQIAALVASLRASIQEIDKERLRAKDAPAFRGMLDARRNNLTLTIAALEDRLSTIQGLLELDRPRIVHWIH